LKEKGLNVTEIDHATDRAVEFDLLGDNDDLEATFAPVGQQVHAIFETAAEAVEFPDDDRLDLADEDVLLEPLEGGPMSSTCMKLRPKA
jgi:hypothetical protein